MVRPPIKKSDGPSRATLQNVSNWERCIDTAIEAAIPSADVIIGSMRMPMVEGVLDILNKKYLDAGWGRRIHGRMVVLEHNDVEGFVLRHPEGHRGCTCQRC